jgi:hypothetical protein
MQTFNFGRMWNFLQFELRARRGEVFLPLLIPAAAYLAISLLQVLYGAAVQGWPATAFAVGSLIAFYITANIHRKDLEPGTASLYLLLPVSSCERVLARWLLTCLFPFAFLTVTLTLLALLFGAVSFADGKALVLEFAPRDALFQSSLPKFIAAHSAFFAGGIFFRKNPIFKTVLVALTITLLLFATKISIGVSGALHNDAFDLGMNFGSLQKDLPTALWGNMIAWLGVMPIGLYLAAYFRNADNELRA